MAEYKQNLITVAKAEDTYDLLEHISWTGVVKPALLVEVAKLSKLLVSEALGTPLPGGLTREQIAGRCFGINYIIHLFEKILKDGKTALEELQQSGIKL